MLLVCIRSYIKSLLRYKLIILDACHPDILCLRDGGRVVSFRAC
jgi:hypothetical protein